MSRRLLGNKLSMADLLALTLIKIEASVAIIVIFSDPLQVTASAYQIGLHILLEIGNIRPK